MNFSSERTNRDMTWIVFSTLNYECCFQRCGLTDDGNDVGFGDGKTSRERGNKRSWLHKFYKRVPWQIESNWYLFVSDPFNTSADVTHSWRLLLLLLERRRAILMPTRFESRSFLQGKMVHNANLTLNYYEIMHRKGKLAAMKVKQAVFQQRHPKFPKLWFEMTETVDVSYASEW